MLKHIDGGYDAFAWAYVHTKAEQLDFYETVIHSYVLSNSIHLLSVVQSAAVQLSEWCLK